MRKKEKEGEDPFVVLGLRDITSASMTFVKKKPSYIGGKDMDVPGRSAVR